MTDDQHYRGLLEQGLRSDPSGMASASADLSGFEIIQKLGQGGMGTVYLAKDKSLGRNVALKIYSAESFDAAGLARFQQEAQIMAKIDNPHVVRIHGVVNSNDDLNAPVCLVLEYIAGGDLSDWVKNRGLPSEAELKRIMLGICEGLSELHAQGIVHRDLKPQNILISEKGVIKVSDFGIAISPDAQTLTQTGFYVGSASYVAPEQMSQSRKEIDQRADIWALGVIMFELLTGDLPQSSLESDPFAKLPKSMRSIVEKCLQRNPRDRYQSVQELRSAILSPQKIKTKPNRWIVPVSIAVLALVAGVFFYSNRNPQDRAKSEDEVAMQPAPKEPPKSNPASDGNDPQPNDSNPSQHLNLIDSLGRQLSPDAGQWRLEGDSLICEVAQTAACISFPVGNVGTNYELSFDFVRSSGVNSLVVYLPTSIGTLTYELDAWNEGLAGAQELNGQDLRYHSQAFSFRITNDRNYKVRLKVTERQILCYIDGQLLHTTELSGLRGSISALWQFPRRQSLSIGAWASSITFRNMILKKNTN